MLVLSLKTKTLNTFKTYIDDGEALAISSTDEIALIPPIGGG